MKRKSTPRKKIKKKLELLVKSFVKKRDNYTCQWCRKQVVGANLHASHVVPVSQDGRLAYDPINLKSLCFHCHMNKWHKNPIEASRWFLSTFPERWVYLEEQKKINQRLGTIKIDWYEERIKTMELLIKGGVE